MVNGDFEGLVESQDELILRRLGLKDLQGTEAYVLLLLGLAVVPGMKVKLAARKFHLAKRSPNLEML